MFLNGLFDDSKPEPGPIGTLGEKRFEDSFMEIGINPRTVITDIDDHSSLSVLLFLLFGLNIDVFSCRRTEGDTVLN